VFWSLAAGASIEVSIRELLKLFDRALHAHAFNVGIATCEEASELFPACEHAILLTDRSPTSDSPSGPTQISTRHASRAATKNFPLFSNNTWELALETILHRHF